jgi:hypothetical protein
MRVSKINQYRNKLNNKIFSYKYYTIMNTKALSILILWLSTALVVWCSTPSNTQSLNQQSSNTSQVKTIETPSNKDPLVWLSDAEKQFMEMFIEEWKQRLTVLWKWRQSIENGNERADLVEGYNVYTRIIAHYPERPNRKKVLVAVYEDWWVPVQSLEDLASTNKRGSINIDGTSYTPYMDSWFFFESEYTDEWNSEITIEFKHNGTVISNTVTLP